MGNKLTYIWQDVNPSSSSCGKFITRSVGSDCVVSCPPQQTDRFVVELDYTLQPFHYISNKVGLADYWGFFTEYTGIISFSIDGKDMPIDEIWRYKESPVDVETSVKLKFVIPESTNVPDEETAIRVSSLIIPSLIYEEDSFTVLYSVEVITNEPSYRRVKLTSGMDMSFPLSSGIRVTLLVNDNEVEASIYDADEYDISEQLPEYNILENPLTVKIYFDGVHGVNEEDALNRISQWMNTKKLTRSYLSSTVLGVNIE